MPPTRLYLVRHAKAGSRTRWNGPDRVRPLTAKGQRQADEIAARLADAGVTRVVTSPYTRCWETVAPLAQKLGIELEESTALEEGAPLDVSAPLFHGAMHGTTVLCSHGDVIEDLLTYVGQSGVDLGADVRFEKGSIWVFDLDGDRVVAATYEAPTS